MQITQSGRSDREGEGSRRSLLIAAVVLLGLILLLAITARSLELGVGERIAFPVAMISATALLLVALVLAGAHGVGERLDDEEQCLRHVLLPAVLVNADSKRVLAANEEAAELLGPGNVTVGAHFSELLGSDSSERTAEIIAAALESGWTDVDACTVRTRSGATRVMRLKATPCRVEGLEHVVVGFAGNDVSQTVAAFARVQERLMSNISHELRTPLNVVMGFSELLTTGTLGELAENQLDAAQECHHGGERILMLVNDILDIGRGRSYYMAGEAQPVNPGEMIRRMQTLLVGQARREDVGIGTRTPDDLPEVDVEERPFKQLLYHMLLHALDRSREGGIVQVSVETDGALTISVTDSGPPVSPGDLQPRKLPSVDEEAARHKLAPPLLGLPLCATLAERLGGRLEAHTDADGTHLRFILPLSEAAEGQ
ncbi:MAG: histidine kinase dimerization/phospho-acceptor domain-containing protein [Armatimonadota bacterium]|nr:histidine kinase dimerization/phospho-acceptor domain-containing protein [Armatimonadota bacterium]